MKEEPFLQANRRASSLQTVMIEYILGVQRKAFAGGGVIKYRRLCQQFLVREKRDASLQLTLIATLSQTDEGLTEFLHPKNSPMPNAVKVLWFFLKPEVSRQFLQN